MNNRFKQFCWNAALILASNLVCLSYAYASGGYDDGTPAGKGNLDLDFTVDPGFKTHGAQSYVVWGYGLTDRVDFHGYLSHESATGVNQVYAGFMYNFYSTEYLDLSTAVGARQRRDMTDLFFPQLLYTVKLKGGFDIIGSFVNVHRLDNKSNLGMTTDIAFRVPIPRELTPQGVRDIKFTLGAFQGISKKWGPTYSIDFRF